MVFAHTVPALAKVTVPPILESVLAGWRWIVAAAAPSAAPAPGKLAKIDGIPRGELFGGGGAVSLEVSADGRWIVVVDDR